MNAHALLLDESGATMVEYAIMLALIAAVCIVVVAALGGTTGDTYASLSSAWADPR